jgi:hypothetical protein
MITPLLKVAVDDVFITLKGELLVEPTTPLQNGGQRRVA